MPNSERSPWPAGWMLVAAVVIMLPYAPTLRMPFDFDDDGCQVYPSEGSLGQRYLHFWPKSLAEFTTHGPFRPVTWAVLDGSAELFGARAVAFHLSRLAWGVVSTWLLLLLLRDLRIGRWAALVAAAAAIWNPVRSEMWINLAPTETIGMPFTMFALWAAVRAGADPRPWRWDLAGFVAALAALACKNTFAVIVPVQLLLRAGSGADWSWAGLRGRVPRLGLLSLTLLLPVGHFVLLQMDRRPRVYSLVGWNPVQLLAMGRAVLLAGHVEFLAPGVALLALFAWRSRATPAEGPAADERRMHRLALLAGGLLFALGVGVYWPIQAVTGRYTVPAVWGLDLCLAVALQKLTAFPAVGFVRLGRGVVYLGLGALLVVMLQREQRYQARCEVLWEALEYVEARATPGSRVGWQGVAVQRQRDIELLDGEGVHFRWHLQNRGHRPDLGVTLVRLERADAPPVLMICGGRNPPPGSGWVLEREFHRDYRMGYRHIRCSLWSKAEGGAS